MNARAMILLLTVVLASAGGQILLRYSAASWIRGRGRMVFLRSVLFSTALPALLLVLGAPILYWKALETLPLSQAYALGALTGVFVQAGSAVFLKEQISRRSLLGALMCCAGIAVWGL